MRFKGRFEIHDMQLKLSPKEGDKDTVEKKKKLNRASEATSPR